VGPSDPHDVAAYDAALPEFTVGPLEPRTGHVVVCDYDPAWPGLSQWEAGSITAALGDRVARLEHVGSTSVPGLPAKPIIDMVLEVPDSADDPGYAGDLEAAKRDLASRDWKYMQQYADAKTDVIIEIMSRAAAGR
jgi:GrpB-like predicted nucleotidyltransferase (UPF0157 family)